MTTVEHAPMFVPTRGCPFCRSAGKPISTVGYHDTAEANRSLPDVSGTLYECGGCGIAYSSHSYSIDALPLLYSKSFTDLAYFDQSPLQRLRKRFIKGVLAGHRVLDDLSMHVLQIPLVRRSSGLKILDVGCGFGEFMEIFRALGNRVTGTELMPELVELGRQRGNDVRFGELEDLKFEEPFDLILFRAVLYRTRDPRRTLEFAKGLLAEGGEISLLDPAPLGSDYFFKKQFPQGHFYIMNPLRYLRMLEGMGLRCLESQQIFGRPRAPLGKVRFFGNLAGLAELLAANLLRAKPYVLNYRLARTD